MAKNIETYSIREDLREDLLSVYRQVAPDCLYQQTAWREVVHHPAQQFYITGRQVYQRISAYLNGNVWMIEGMRNKLKQQLYYDIMEVIIALSQKVEYQGKRLRALCEAAVKMPAPRFYVSEMQLCHMFHGTIDGIYDADGRNTKTMASEAKRKDFQRQYYLAHKDKYPR